ncbi:MAG: hypothetical protein J2P57_03510 [Acidimicrobiaceae bacterium]|nr:hypothetical protein [Acidimicrobiaceae bacterium]
MDPIAIDHETVPGAALTAFLLHPHPDMGGNRFNHVIEAIYRSLPGAGVSAVRFDLSSSEPGRARADTVAALDLVDAARVVLVGYSFGADVALGVDDRRIAGWFAIAPPLRLVGVEAAAADQRPKALLVAEQDQWSPPSRVREQTAAWTNTTVTALAGADHFLNGHGAAVAGAVRAWVAPMASGD